MSRCKFSFNLCIVTTGWNSNSNQGEWGQYSDGTEHPRERFTQWWYLHTASMTLTNIKKFEIDKHYRHKKGLSPKKLMPCFVQIDDLVFTFCSSQSHQGSNFQGRGSHDRKNWSHVSSSYSNVLFIRLSISFVLCLTMPTLPFARSGYMSSVQETMFWKVSSDQFVALLRNGFRAKAPSPNFAQGKKCLFITLAYISGLFVSVTSINFKPNSQMDFLKLFIMNHDWSLFRICTYMPYNK